MHAMNLSLIAASSPIFIVLMSRLYLWGIYLFETCHGYHSRADWCPIVDYGRLLTETFVHFLRDRRSVYAVGCRYLRGLRDASKA